jgi:hypothetical protein
VVSKHYPHQPVEQGVGDDDDAAHLVTRDCSVSTPNRRLWPLCHHGTLLRTVVTGDAAHLKRPAVGRGRRNMQYSHGSRATLRRIAVTLHQGMRRVARLRES